MVDFSLQDKVALVTGGSRGIGAAIGKAFCGTRRQGGVGFPKTGGAG